MRPLSDGQVYRCVEAILASTGSLRHHCQDGNIRQSPGEDGNFVITMRAAAQGDQGPSPAGVLTCMLPLKLVYSTMGGIVQHGVPGACDRIPSSRPRARSNQYGLPAG